MVHTPLHLNPGSRYRIRSLASRDATIETEGTFRGFVNIGTIDAFAMELPSENDGPGPIRIIPTHVVVAVDILEAAADDADVDEDVSMHYS